MSAIKRPPSPPPSFNATARSLAKATEDLLKTSKAVQDSIVASVTPSTATFDNTILPLVHDENERIYKQQLIEFYSHVSTDDSIRDASNDAERDFARFTADTAVRDDLYALIAAVRDNGDPASLDPESVRLLEKLLEGFEQNGLALNIQDRARLRKLNDQLAVTKDEYLKCIMHAQDEGLCFTRDELEGIDEDVLADLEQTTDGKLRYKLDTLLRLSLMRKASRQATRRQVYIDFARKCEPNVTRLDHILSLRREKAHLLGYADYAECRMAENMEKSPASVRAFLENLLAKLAPVRDQLIENWRQMKKDDLTKRGEPDDGKFYPWDRPYYSTMWAKSQQAATDDIEIEEYFPLQPTITRMLAMFESVFGLRFIEVDEAERQAWEDDGLAQAPLLWHPDARLFAVWDANEHGDPAQFIGYLYTDMYARPGKYPGYADFPVRPAFTLPSGARRHTATALICAFDRPTPTRSALLQHPYVLTLFHELGHGLHDLAATTRYARFHGASTSADFNEAPSQMLEQWVWRPSTLLAISGHYATGECLPERAVQRLLRDRLRTERTKTLALLEMSLEDLALNAAEPVDPTEVHARTAWEVWRVDSPEEPVAAQAVEISHVTVSGMYMYLTCQVYAFDMFAVGFGAEPVTREQGRRYRELVIGRGSSVDEMVMLKEFLGRAPSAGAMFEVLGLAEGA